MAVAPQHERLEHPFDGFVQLGGDMHGSQIVLVEPVGNQPVGYLLPIEQPGGVRFVDFDRHIRKCFATRR